MSETTLQEAAYAIMSSLETDYQPGYMPHVIPWCKFVTEYTTEYDYHIPGIFDRVYKKPRQISYGTTRAWYSDLSRYFHTVRYTTSMQQDTLRLILWEHYQAKKCIYCGEFYVVDTNNFDLCEKCFFTHLHSCRICGFQTSFDEHVIDVINETDRYLPEATYRRIGGIEKVVCKECARRSDVFMKCDCCGNVMYKSDIVYGKIISNGTRRLRFCKACANAGEVTYCGACSAYVLKGEMIDSISNARNTGMSLCIQCHLKYVAGKKKAEIHSHTYRPRLIFLSTTPEIKAPYGLEIEVDDGRHSDNLMEYLEDLKEMIKLKSDGSLNNGFEIITYPATLDFHRSVVPYEEMFEKLRNDGYTSHENSTCGLHIHIGRTGFGSTARSQNPAIGRFIWLTEAFREKLRVFSRRKEYRYCQFYGFPASYTPKQMLLYARSENRNSRYKSVNMQNSGTIEVRIFKGSLKRNTVLASIELCDFMRRYATENKDDTKYTPSVLTWETFTSGIRSTEYPNLKEYLVHKRLI